MNLNQSNNEINMNNLADFLNKANNILSCDSECQKNNKINELKQKYLDSVTNSKTSNIQEEQAYKNYIVYSQGTQAYNEHLDKSLNEKANKIAQMYEKNFNDNFSYVMTLLNSYKGLLVNFTNIYDYYFKFLDENTKYENNSKIQTADVLTNHRKTFYEEQNIDRIKLINTILFWIYYIFSVIFVVLFFIYSSNYRLISRILITIILFIYFIIYPYIAFKTSVIVINSLKNIKNSIFPKNIYTNL